MGQFGVIVYIIDKKACFGIILYKFTVNDGPSCSYVWTLSIHMDQDMTTTLKGFIILMGDTSLFGKEKPASQQ